MIAQPDKTFIINQIKIKFKTILLIIIIHITINNIHVYIQYDYYYYYYYTIISLSPHLRCRAPQVVSMVRVGGRPPSAR